MQDVKPLAFLALDADTAIIVGEFSARPQVRCLRNPSQAPRRLDMEMMYCRAIVSLPGRLIAVAGYAYSSGVNVSVFDLDTGARLQTLSLQHRLVVGLGCVADRLIAISQDGTMLVWQLDAGSQRVSGAAPRVFPAAVAAAAAMVFLAPIAPQTHPSLLLRPPFPSSDSSHWRPSTSSPTRR